jgi:hypothetical protein
MRTVPPIKEQVELRKAAEEWAANLRTKPVDARDSAFAKIDRRLMRAALRYAGATVAAPHG